MCVKRQDVLNLMLRLLIVNNKTHRLHFIHHHTDPDTHTHTHTHTYTHTHTHTRTHAHTHTHTHNDIRNDCTVFVDVCYKLVMDNSVSIYVYFLF